MGLGPFNFRFRLFAVFFLVAAFLGCSLFFATPTQAAAGINQQMNFQGRLLNSNGATVPDGYYNLEFKIYQDGDGQSVGDTTGTPAGSLKWTEDYLNANGQGVVVKNGFLSVQLGSVNPFGTSVDWNQSNLWLSMNIAGTGASCTPFSSCTPDGEMTPMKRLSSNAYAFNAAQLGGLTAAGFIQNNTVQQTASFNVISSNAANVTGTLQGASGQTADIFRIYDGSSNLRVSVNAAGTLTATKGFIVNNNGANPIISAVSNNASAVGVVIKAVSGQTADLLQVQDSTTANLLSIGANGSITTSGAISATGNVNTSANIQTGGTTRLNNTGALSNITGYAQSSGNFSQTGTGTFGTGTGNVSLNGNVTLATGKTLGATGNITTTTTVQGATINATTGYQANGTSGSTTTCTGGTYLQNAVVAGGIITGGTCVAASNGITTVGTIDTQTKSTDGAVIVGTTLYLQTADASRPGLVSNGTQTFSGVKTFSAGLNIASGQVLQINGVNTLGANGLTFSAASTGSITAATSQALNITANAASTFGTSAGILTLAGAGGSVIQTNGTTRATFDTANGLYLGNGVTAAAPNNFVISGTGSSLTAVAGGAITLQGGAATVGNANGGNLTLSGGAGFGTGSNGLVVISTPTFSTTANDANCYTGGTLVAASCTIAASSVNNTSAIIVGFSSGGQTATLPNPSIATAGRVVYITAANGSSDFTLSVNGGGQGNTIAMRQNTTATMIWSGTAWTAAGASSSTTLQSAYDNTLQSAGGAELIVSHTSNTNGLTIRDSSTNPVNGTLLSVQTASAAVLLSVNSNVTEYSTDGGAETAGASASTFPASTWGAVGSASTTRYTSVGNFIATGQASVGVTTTAAANDGVKDTLSTALTANTHYNISFAARLSSGTFTDMNVYYSINGTAASVACTTSQAVATSIWTKVNCTFTAPSSGITAGNAVLIRQTAGAVRTFYVDNLSVTIAGDFNYASDGGVDDSTNFATNWTAASATVTRSTTVGNDASDSAQVVTTGTGQGVRNKLSINPLQSTLYRITVYATTSTSGFNSFTIRYSRDGGTNFVNCADYNTQSVANSATDFTKITCYITTDGTAASNPYVYFTQSDASGRTFYVDTFSMTLTTNTTPNVQVGGGVNGGPVTLFTLDKGASAPIASNNDALLGSMYYDTTLGKLQCYEADGWGACGSSPDNIVTISPEYTNAVMHGTGVGTMTSDLCSYTLNINNGTSGQPTICGTNETYNYYKWTSPQASAQTYSIYVTYQLPTTFKSFQSGQTSIMGRTDSSNATVQYQVYRNDPSSGLTQCGSNVPVSSGSVSSWQTGIANGAADPSTCGFSAGNSIVFKIDVIASSNANAYVGNLNFTFSNR